MNLLECMRRRELLRGGVGSICLVSGCLQRQTDTFGSTDEIPEPSGQCASAAALLSERMTSTWEQTLNCPEDEATALEIQNETERPRTVDIRILDGSDEERLTREKTLASHEWTKIGDAIPTNTDISIEVTTGDGEERAREFSAPVCVRLGVVFDPDGVEIGFVPPLYGHPDTMHDCYTREAAPVRFTNHSELEALEFSVVDNCREEVRRHSIDLRSGRPVTYDDLLEAGGHYELIAEVPSGSRATYSFHDECVGVNVVIDSLENVAMQQIAVL